MRAGAVIESAIKSGLRRDWRLRMAPPPDRLRDHPEFALHEESATETGAPNVLPGHSVCEEEREPTYRVELLRMYRQRLHLLATLALLMLPWSTFLYLYLVPVDQSDATAQMRVWRPIIIAQIIVFLVTLVVHTLARRVNNLFWARLLSLLFYTAFAVGTAVIAAFTSTASLSNQSMILGEANIVVYGGYNQILLSVLLLPYSVWENLVIGVLVLASVIWSLWWALAPGFQYLFYPHFFVLFTTGLVVLCIGHFQDVLRRRAFDSAFDLALSAAQLQMLSTLDTVTGGFNRLYLEKMLNIEIARATRFERPLSVLMFDLDNFKKVNDTNGHAAGDAVLREVSQAALGIVREIDTVARYGGDEFIIVLPETDQDDARAVAERLHSAVATRLRERFSSDSAAAGVTLSVGLLTIKLTEPVSLDSIMRRVDERLYEAKRQGKNRTAS